MDGSERKRVRMFVKFVNVLINFKRGEKLRFAFIDRRKLGPCVFTPSAVRPGSHIKQVIYLYPAFLTSCPISSPPWR